MHSNMSLSFILLLSILLSFITSICEGGKENICPEVIPFTRIQHPYQPEHLWGYIGSPYPTSAHWTNFVLNNGTKPAFPLPYYVYKNDSGLYLLYSEPTCSYEFCTTSFVGDLFFGSTELEQFSMSYLTYHDSLSVSVIWKPLRIQHTLKILDTVSKGICKGSMQNIDQQLCEDTRLSMEVLKSAYKKQYFYDLRQNKIQPSSPELIYGIKPNAMVAHLVYGSPYITIKYGSITPVISGISSISLINSERPSPDKIYDGSKLTILLENNKKYIIYSTRDNLSFKWEEKKLVATSAYYGVIRVAISNSDEHTDILDKYVTPYAIGGTVNVEFSYSQAKIYFDWIYERSTIDEEDLLMLTLPHHRISMSPTENFIKLPLNTIKGKMYGFLGKRWVLYEPIESLPGFNSERPISPKETEEIAKAVKEDIKNNPSAPSTTYEFGNYASRYARLCLIANYVRDFESRDIFLERLENALNPWLESLNDNKLLYDETWKGIVSTHSLKSSNEEYGQGYYNDHHHHWGYLIYASAVLAKFKQGWIEPHASAINALIRDIATSDKNDPCFPFTRHKDWFMGHSWASGLFEFIDGKNQESTSEAVNAYYAVSLWGFATGNISLVNWGRLLASTEIRSAQTYWQMSTGQDPYLTIFSNNQCVGILWCSKIEYTTWFGKNIEYIHEIQMLPFTPISMELISRNWVLSEYPILKKALVRSSNPIEESWKGFIFITQSFVDKKEAWKNALQLKSFHMGNSKANTLYMIASNINTHV